MGEVASRVIHLLRSLEGVLHRQDSSIKGEPAFLRGCYEGIQYPVLKKIQGA